MLGVTIEFYTKQVPSVCEGIGLSEAREQSCEIFVFRNALMGF